MINILSNFFRVMALSLIGESICSGYSKCFTNTGSNLMITMQRKHYLIYIDFCFNLFILFHFR